MVARIEKFAFLQIDDMLSILLDYFMESIMKKVLFGLMGATFAFADAEEATRAYDLYAGAGASYQMFKQTLADADSADSKKHSKLGGSIFFGGMYFADDYGFGLELGYDLARSKKYETEKGSDEYLKVRGCNPWLVAQIAYKYNGFIPAIRFGMKHVNAQLIDDQGDKEKVSKIAFTLGAGLRYNLCNRFGVEAMYDYAFKAKKNFKANDKITQKLTGNNIRLAVTYSF